MKRSITSRISRRALAGLAATIAIVVVLGNTALAQADKVPYSSAKDWDLKAEFLKPQGVNPWFLPLKPGQKFILQKEDAEDGLVTKEVHVTDEIEEFEIPGIGKFECAVVVEEEFYDGAHFQNTVNWYAIDTRNNNIYTFGLLSWEIDSEGDRVFEGSWRAGQNDGNGLAEPGLLMPGTPAAKQRYISAGDESEAFAGTEILETGLSLETPAGKFEDCLRTRESRIDNPADNTDRIWCKGVGLISDTDYGKLVASSSLAATEGRLEKQWQQFLKPPLGPKYRPKLDPAMAKVTKQQAEKIALKVVPDGKITSVVLEKKKGKSCWVVELRNKANEEIDVFVDIVTGKVVGTDK